MQEHISFSSVEEMKTICAPLFEHLPIRIFEYSRIYKNGKRSELCTNAAHLENAFGTNRAMRRIFTPSLIAENCHYLIIEKWINSVPKSKRQKLEEQLVSQRELFNIGNELVIVKHYPNYTECFHFYADANSSTVLNTMFNALALLEHFVIYFVNKAHHLIQQSINMPLIQPWLKTTEIKTSPESFLNQSSIDVESFLSSTKFPRFVIQQDTLTDIYLTEREVQCGKLFTQGYSVKEIANRLSLSTRTAETYINNIKEKLNCTRKNDVIDKLMTLGIDKFLLACNNR